MKTRIKRSRSIKPKLNKTNKTKKTKKTNKTNKRKAYKGKKRITRKMLKPHGRKSRNKKYTGGLTKTPVAVVHTKSGENEFGFHSDSPYGFTASGDIRIVNGNAQKSTLRMPLSKDVTRDEIPDYRKELIKFITCEMLQRALITMIDSLENLNNNKQITLVQYEREKKKLVNLIYHIYQGLLKLEQAKKISDEAYITLFYENVIENYEKLMGLQVGNYCATLFSDIVNKGNLVDEVDDVKEAIDDKKANEIYDKISIFHNEGVTTFISKVFGDEIHLIESIQPGEKIEDKLKIIIPDDADLLKLDLLFNSLLITIREKYALQLNSLQTKEKEENQFSDNYKKEYREKILDSERTMGQYDNKNWLVKLKNKQTPISLLDYIKLFEDAFYLPAKNFFKLFRSKMFKGKQCDNRPYEFLTSQKKNVTKKYPPPKLIVRTLARRWNTFRGKPTIDFTENNPNVIKKHMVSIFNFEKYKDNNAANLRLFPIYILEESRTQDRDPTKVTKEQVEKYAAHYNSNKTEDEKIKLN